MVSIQHAGQSQIAVTALRQADRVIAASSAKLSTGLRIQSAADNAAGVALASRFTAESRAMMKVSDSVHAGLSITQVADTGLGDIRQSLHRMRELAVQAATGTLSDPQRSMLDEEFSALKSEIDAVTVRHTAFDKYPLAKPEPVSVANAPTLGNTLPLTKKLVNGATSLTNYSSGLVSLSYIPVGVRNVSLTVDGYSGAEDDIQVFTRDGKHLMGTPILGSRPDRVWIDKGVTSVGTANTKVLTAANGFSPGASYNASYLPDSGTSFDNATLPVVSQYGGMTLRWSGDGDRSVAENNDGNTNLSIENLRIDQVTEELIVMVVGSGVFGVKGSWVDPAPVAGEIYGTSTNVLVSASSGTLQYKTIPATPADTATLGISSHNISSAATAIRAISTLDAAIAKTADYAAQHAAVQSSLVSVKDYLSQSFVDTVASRSTVTDLDYAEQTSELSRAQALLAAAQSTLHQTQRETEVALGMVKSNDRLMSGG